MRKQVRTHFTRLRQFDWRWLYLVLFYLLLVSLITPRGHEIDLNGYIDWARKVGEWGIGGIYQDGGITYMPLNLYLLGVWQQLANLVGLSLGNALGLFKAFMLVFDFGSIAVVMLILKHFKLKWELILLLLFNVAFWYNAMMWGQFDGVYTFLSFLAIYSALRERPVWSVLFYMLALNAKLQALAFAPVLALLLLPQLLRQRRKVIYLGLVLSVQIAIILPFMAFDRGEGLIKAISNSTAFFPQVSLNAYNLWFFLFGADAFEINDTLQLLWWNARQWGLALLALTTAVSLIPLLAMTWRNWKQRLKFSVWHWQLVCLTGATMALSFFFFNTQMHERYSHPVILLSAVFGMLSGKYLLYVATSVLYLINVESVLHFWQLPNNIYAAIDGKLIAVGFFLLLMYCWWQLFKIFSSPHHDQ